MGGCYEHTQSVVQFARLPAMTCGLNGRGDSRSRWYSSVTRTIIRLHYGASFKHPHMNQISTLSFSSVTPTDLTMIVLC